MLAEDGQRADVLADLVGAIIRDEGAGDQVCGQLPHGDGRVGGLSGEDDRIVVEIGGEDADSPIGQRGPEQLGHQDRQRVGLLAGGAAGRPDAELVVALPGVRDQLGQHRLAQVGEEFRIAEEIGHFDQEVADEFLVFLGMVVEIGHVAGDIGGVRGDDPTVQAATDRRLLVAAEIDAVPLADLFQESAERLIIQRSRRHLLPDQEVVEDRADPGQIGDNIHVGRVERAGHGGVGGGVGVLDHHRAAQSLDDLRPGRAVRAQAGQDHGDQLLAIGRRRRLQQQVHRGRRSIGTIDAQIDRRFVEEDVAVGGDDVDDARFQGRVLLDDADGQRAAPLQDGVQDTRAFRIEVLGEHDRRGEIGRQGRHERRECINAARRRADHHQLGQRSLLLVRHTHSSPLASFDDTPAIAMFVAHSAGSIPARRILVHYCHDFGR